MKVRVNLSRENQTKTIEVKEKATSEDVLKQINLKPDTVIIMHNNKPIPIDNELSDNQEITIIQVSSGG